MIQVVFVHYALYSSKFPKTFKSIQKNITAKNINELFKEPEADVIFYGHEHQDSQLEGENTISMSVLVVVRRQLKLIVELLTLKLTTISSKLIISIIIQRMFH